MATKHFIAGALKHPGALSRSAHAAGESPMAFAREHAHSTGVTGSRARFALLLNRVRPGGKARHRIGKPKKQPDPYEPGS